MVELYCLGGGLPPYGLLWLLHFVVLGGGVLGPAVYLQGCQFIAGPCVGSWWCHGSGGCSIRASSTF